MSRSAARRRALEVGVFAWLAAPILIAYFLSRTGRYESAHVLSSLALAGLVTVVAALTGGIASFAAIWLVVVPLEAALSASRRVVALASTVALGAAGVLLLLSAFDLAAAAGSGRDRTRRARRARHHLGFTLRHRACARRRAARAHRCLAALCRGRPLPSARAQHDRRDHPPWPQRRGAVRVAGGASNCSACAPDELNGHGLFDRVHVADRPAYLTALTDAATLREDRSVEFRIRRDDQGGDCGQFVWVEMRCRPLDRDADESQRRRM